ncbi:hypothetical protein EI42_04484 [Thermosporothrix hazakensis]|jgi:hypothetical protein|uniref:Uncharacterized protein n=2 Tax=Thermosporothrix TaxID=768650 RepID=A0A326U1R8_THEHA|nr:hypothetical protein [Thermosporothrix hazakensis]PZW24876.1 hypothetical protein EI42_04484 [Thermosporothrix hazakensis]BBH88249.1 hypothetical protein KTC_30000 [Thermosporothrix sp. COM3]GCE46436.1 hypothetical protein KTH_13050 [Thermosporothrix hazakensis]
MHRSEVDALREQIYLACVSLRDLHHQSGRVQGRLQALVAALDKHIGVEATNRLVASICLKVDIIPAYFRLPQDEYQGDVACRDEKQHSTSYE